MILSNNYYYFTSALDENTCNKILQLGKDTLKSEGFLAETYDKRSTAHIKNPIESQGDKTLSEVDENAIVRDSKICWLEDRWLYELLQPFLHTANEKAGWNFHWDWSESVQFTEYGLNQFYGWHYDGKSDSLGAYKTDNCKNPNMVGKVRKLSMTVNLSKPGEYEGGNLKFDYGPHTNKKEERFHECVEIRPQGSIIVFPAFTYHQVTPVTKGTRYSLVMQNCGNPFV